MSAAAAQRPAPPRLRELLRDLTDVNVADMAITGLSLDSRKLAAGNVFLACAGRRVHGLVHAADAIRGGATAVLWEPAPGQRAPRRMAGIPFMAVPALGRKAGIIADRYFGSPSTSLTVGAVTGTNGKSSVAWMLATAENRLGRRNGLIGTLGYGFVDDLEAADLTTPDPVTLHARLASLRDAGASGAAIEVSSHALEQHRVAGLRIDTSVFTNLSRDHLDYHGNLKRYGEAKARLFTDANPRCAVINTDDSFGRALFERLPGGVEAIAVGHAQHRPPGASFVELRATRANAEGLAIDFGGTWGGGTLEAPVIGQFNALNILSVLAVLLGRGIALERACTALNGLQPPPGRMERFGGGRAPLVVVDYAHTPDALEKALVAARAHCAGSLWCVFGCGGERDPGKRADMAAVAESLADRVIVTDDNPREEDPEQIVADIMSGISDRSRVLVERVRAAAIERALRGAASGDVVLVAGKGHEDYQIVGRTRIPFSDRGLVTRLLEASR